MTPEQQLFADTEEVCAILFAPHFPITQHRFNNVQAMLPRLPKADAIEAANITIKRFPYAVTPRLQYWAGICWRKIRGEA